MKKLMITLFASVLLLGVSSVSLAQNAKTPKAVRNASCRNFVDKNNDGICDNREVSGQNTKGRNFVDKNNDGFCDNQGKGNRRNGKGCVYGNQNRQRNGRK